MSRSIADLVKLGEAAMEQEDYDLSVDYFNQGLAIEPENFAVLFGMAEVLRFREDYKEAAEFYSKAQRVDPEEFYGHWEMAYSYDMAGQFAEAKAGYEDCLRRDPNHGVARHLLSALVGETSAAAPKDYIEELFDDYAETFDESLLNDLDYTVPDLIRQKLDVLDPGARYQEVMDLGCGTGLVGAAIGELCGDIDGIDLSAKMIEQAVSKNIYRRTMAGDIAACFETETFNNAKYDLIVAGDVFVYYGDLIPVFKSAKEHLKKNGRFLFTIEKLAGDKGEPGYEIQRSGRFAHNRNYLNLLAKRWDFMVETIEEIVPRKEGELLISGYLCSLVNG